MTKKSLISVLLTVIMLFAMMPFSGAANVERVTTETVDLGDGFTAEITTTVIIGSVQGRAGEQTITGKKETDVIYNGMEIGKLKISGNFSYDGSSARATSDSCSAYAESGYRYSGKSSSHSGATVRGSCTFTGNGANKYVSLSMTCDRNGNVS
ncbi:MAG: hypothetical protein HFH26_10110 [Clostridiaceae bacterium]|nr:hypothetical protein [Clostridiaceae bacterium]